MIKHDIDGDIGNIIIDRPDRLNALGLEAFTEIQSTLETFKQEGVRVIILRSSGNKAFVAGADLKEIGEMSNSEFLQFQREARKTHEMIESHESIVIAAVDGLAYGGGFEIALSSDIIIAGQGASFAFPEVKLGLIPGHGGPQRLSRIVGAKKVLQLVITGDELSATEAFEMNIVHRLVENAEVATVADKVAQDIAENAPLAVRAANLLLREATESNLDSALSYEQLMTYRLFDTEDAQEGISAFIENREPNFVGE